MRQLFTVLILIASLSAQAQSWQWGKRGGSSDGSNSGLYEQIVDMTTDNRGNVYVLARTHQNGVNVDGFTTTGTGRGNMIIASWSCAGTRRWVKYIGSFDGNGARAIGVDTLGGVYVAGTLRSSNSSGYFKVGSDTTFGLTTKSFFLLKLDTAGAYKWIRMPQADTVGSWSYSRTGPFDMAVENNGTVHLFSQLAPGAYQNGALVISNFGLYMMRYDRNGIYQNNTSLQITIPSTGVSDIRMARDPRNGKYFFTGSALSGLSYGSNSTSAGFYVAAYNPQGQIIWFKQNTAQFTGSGGRAAIDNQGSVYITGATYPNDVFNGHVFTNPMTTLPHGFPFLVKLDSNGNNQWVASGQVNTGVGASAVALTGNTVAILGQYPGTLKFGTLQVSNPSNTSQDLFLARFNAATGAVVGLDSIKSPSGFLDLANTLTADRQGNFYVGAEFSSQLTVASQALISTGGETDWMIAKYGTNNCSCTLPTASFGKTVNNATRTGTFTFSGAVAGLDSLVWEWGDGTRTKLTSNFAAPINHTYAGSTTSFNACVTAYSSCGTNQSCQAVLFTIGVDGLTGLGSITVYPNPATNALNIEGAEIGTSYRLFSLLGQQLQAGTISANIHTCSLTALPAGTYILQITAKDGSSSNVQVMKY